MKNKLSVAILCFLSLFAIIQGLIIKPEDLDDYYECWTYAKCFSDGPPAENMENCVKIMKPEEYEATYKYVADNYYDYKSDDIGGGVREYCNLDDSTRRDAYNKSLNGMIAYQKKVCAEPDKAGACDRITKSIDCLFLYLGQLKQQDQCKTSGSIGKLPFNNA
ncbi:uncharacterized protein LOC129974906 [Argiope bruennichi]|uniref:Uncharacterized protein n=1 Tax=Argiope bruennichi TaxID=94029 RepID=A0A8T0ENT6_ARGBR|nr:uncharacterized protein LOC129974906 [Argiope bruennichi]KAF8777118.1 hypothetical protein HNY73_014039 [Argiope bruennichi]